ncbi:hypothetical protein TNCV_2290211 [Trichonephila clavipes]|uniref:Uncharacterized protein n=1 Tax=Trichonephila clavipes TaxID=2585209 RepID=A0A8X6RW62_TRICX|nr:hypothetical protein TNCV_2290211 [Trichonephila clavipes]
MQSDNQEFWNEVSFYLIIRLFWFHPIRNNLKIWLYIDEFLGLTMLPYLSRMSELVFQLDDARPQKAYFPAPYIRASSTVFWPVRSQHLSPIEYVWVLMSKCLRSSLDHKRFKSPI